MRDVCVCGVWSERKRLFYIEIHMLLKEKRGSAAAPYVSRILFHIYVFRFTLNQVRCDAMRRLYTHHTHILIRTYANVFMKMRFTGRQQKAHTHEMMIKDFIVLCMREGILVYTISYCGAGAVVGVAFC